MNNLANLVRELLVHVRNYNMDCGDSLMVIIPTDLLNLIQAHVDPGGQPFTAESPILATVLDGPHKGETVCLHPGYMACELPCPPEQHKGDVVAIEAGHLRVWKKVHSIGMDLPPKPPDTPAVS